MSGIRTPADSESSEGQPGVITRDSSRGSVIIYNNYSNCQVNNVGHIENAYFGHNTTNESSDASGTATEGLAFPSSELSAILTPVPDASYTRNRKISPPDSDCLPGTRGEVIRGITNWADSPILFNSDTPRIFWTHGYVGCGKSSISQAVSQRYGRKGRLLGSFFFYRNSGDRSRMVKFAVTLASQMLAAVPATKSFYKAAVDADPTLLTRGASLSTQMERLVYKPFNAAFKRGLIFKTLIQGPFLVVVDGLDECEDKLEVKEFVEHLLDFFKRHPSTPLRFFITSRVERHLKECLNVPGVKLDDLVAHGSDDDILTFLETSFAHRVERDLVLAAEVRSSGSGQWPSSEDLKTLVHHIGGSFIFASVVFRYIVEPSNDGSTPMTRLPLALNMNPGLDGLYTFTLARSQRLHHFADVISTLALLFQPLSITAITDLLGIKMFEVLHILVNLQSVIHIPGTDERPVTFCHTSLRDFLTTESRSGRFFAPPSHHLYLSHRCSLVQDKPEGVNAAASYAIENCGNHFEKFACLPPYLQGAFLQTIEALYALILEKSQASLHFFDILWTVALVFEPLPISAIAQLLELKPSVVSGVLSSLQPIIHISSYRSLVSFRHPSLYDYLSTESRSGRFFAPPSFHRYLFYCCLALREEQQTETAATLYSVVHQSKHFSFFSPNEQEQFVASPSPNPLDAFYLLTLSRAQDLPHFSNIISTIASLTVPLSINGVTELLDIEPSDVVQVLINVQAIIISPGTNDIPSTMCHTSLRNFLTDESRSGPFFISPSYQLQMSYYCFALKLKHLLSKNETVSPATEYSIQYCRDHWINYPYSTSGPRFLVELEQLSHPPNQPLSFYLFSFTRTFFRLRWDDGRRPMARSDHVFQNLTRCAEFLALSLECDSTEGGLGDGWLYKSFSSLEMDVSNRDSHRFGMHKEEATALRCIVDRMVTAIRRKFPGLSKNATPIDKHTFVIDKRIGAWTPMDSYHVPKGESNADRAKIASYSMFNNMNNIVIGHVESAIFGDNSGTVNQGRSRPAAGSYPLYRHALTGQTELIQLLQPIVDASHTRNREISPPNSACFPGTRRDVTRKIVTWADSTLLWSPHVLWLHGYVGCGKSAIALTIALKYERRQRLVGSFFFFRNTGDRSKMTRFATTLACQLAAAIPEAAIFIEKAVKAEPGLLSSNLVTQLRHLVYEPFRAAAKSGRLLKTTFLKGPFLIVVDGLDECEDRQEVQSFIDDMLEFFRKNPRVPLRFLITSRVEQHIQRHLDNDQVRLENLVHHCSREDIYAFIHTCFEEEKKRNAVIKAYIRRHGDWPTKGDKDQLVDYIGGSFFFASALFKYIIDPTNTQSTPMDRLPHTLSMSPDLDMLYASTLSQSQHLPHFSDIISTLALLFEPLPIVSIAQLIGIDHFEVVRVLVNLQAIIHIPETDDLPVTMCHESLRDFLTTETRSGTYFVSPLYHLKLSLHFFSLNLELPRDSSQRLSGLSRFCMQRSRDHSSKFLSVVPSEQGFLHELNRLSHLPHRSFSYHLFSLTRVFLWVIGTDCHQGPQQIVQPLVKCVEFLALALECDPAPDGWLRTPMAEFGRLVGDMTLKEGVFSLNVHQKDATALQHNVERIETAIIAKVCMRPFCLRVL
ncbi:hypothetical protein MD484_g8842, partial [Candolleomyces efflorescens]